MKKCILFILTAMILFSNLTVVFSDETMHHKRIVRYAFTSFFTDIDLSFALGAIDLWGKKIGDRAGFESQCYMLDSIDKLSEKIRNNEIDIASTLSVDYLRMKKTLNIELAYARISNNSIAESYYVLARKDANISAISDLKDKRFALTKNDEIAKLYINTLLLKEFQQELSSVCSSITHKTKFSQSCYAVFFGDADACIVLQSTYDLLCELNPQVKQAVNIISISQPFVRFITFYRQNFEEHIKILFKNAVLSMFDHEEGKQMMMLFKVDGIQEIIDEHLESVANLIKEYETLKQ
ncbi:MAG: PhnD/SsuA/transferrin family substrate-binding protein [Candidatus Magnetomorum sp.]|nr:PhnD/SsuA/transferrin family substrate-binding protein [Candidatus Magnetomorum sp.]